MSTTSLTAADYEVVIGLEVHCQLKTNTILIKVTAAERQTFQLAAEHAGDNVANWMRRTCRERASHELANKGIKAPIDEVNGTDSTGSRTT